ncbi:hypothetical protein GOP47_0013261 [Adiantum capillus-veneris]|uniref:Uncharacterized protein n=1 Tax=Adiantum capillus-veneris TaxID=13818 RepID=A0A9D4UN57_ADICA|nr:hypothetical protein GOP47_0013261 [Adiantum capillus-veneris]
MENKEIKNHDAETQYTSSLQQHVAFFDRNKDGKIYPSETYNGFRALGFTRPISIFASIFIHLGLSYKTLDSPIPSLLFPIYIKNINRGRHPNDSGIYDNEDKFTHHKLDELFKEFAKTFPDRISLDEMNEMRKSFYKGQTISGRLASKVEWQFAHNLLKDDNGYVSKEHIKRIFDGSIFYYIEEEHKRKISEDGSTVS